MRNDVLELMQRALDGDLSDEEWQLLHYYLARDAELRLTYERLKKVSEQLEQLPPVTPPFSLVDSILPQIQRSAAEETAVQLSAPAAPDGQAGVVGKPSANRRRLPVWLAKAGTGAIAASLLVGLFLGVNTDRQPDSNLAAPPAQTSGEIPQESDGEPVVEKVSTTGTPSSAEPGGEQQGKTQDTEEKPAAPAAGTGSPEPPPQANTQAASVPKAETNKPQSVQERTAPAVKKDRFTTTEPHPDKKPSAASNNGRGIAQDKNKNQREDKPGRKESSRDDDKESGSREGKNNGKDKTNKEQEKEDEKEQWQKNLERSVNQKMDEKFNNFGSEINRFLENRREEKLKEEMESLFIEMINRRLQNH